MKVVCQKCSAAYAINEAAIPVKGARAQCPRCKALQTVMRPAAAEAPAASASPAAPPPSPPPPPLPSRRPAAASDDPFANLNLGAPAPPPPGAPPPPPAGPAPSAAEPDPFAGLDFGAASSPAAGLDLSYAPPPPAGAPPAAPPPAPLGGTSAGIDRPNSDPFANLDLGDSGSGSQRLPSGVPDPFAANGANRAAAPGPMASARVPLGKCKSCGKDIYDPFDAALGTCESCRAKEMASAPVSSGDGLQGEPTPGFDSDKPLETAKPAPPPRPAAAATNPSKPAVSNPTRPRADSGSRAGWVILAVLVLGGGLATYRLKPGVFGPSAPPTVPVPEVVSRALSGWRLAHPNVQGTPAEHMVHGRDHIDLDRVGDYRIAEEEFKEAALQAGNNPALLAESVAGAVEAFALRNTDLHDTTGLEDQRALLEGAAKLAPGTDAVVRAQVYLLLWQGGPSSVEPARKAAKTAFDVASPASKGDALLAQGCAFLDSAQMAYEFLDKALQSNPRLLRAYYYRGLAAERVGHYASAKKDFEKRLSMDPDAARAQIELARLDVLVGDMAQAKKDLMKQGAPVNLEARLMLAKIEFQAEHSNPQAEADIQAILEADPAPPKVVLADALVNGAALSREKGDFATARSRTDDALKLQPDYPPALFQKVLIAIASNHAADGDAPLKKLIAANPDGVKLDELKGRMAFLEGRADECVLEFRTALTKNSQDLHAALLGGALASAAGKSDASYELMSKALEIDPASDTHHRGLSDYYESPKSELSATAGGFEKEDRVLAQPMAFSGILHYFRGDVTGAERFLNDALKIEPGSAAALSYLAQISMDRKKYPKAEELAAKGLESERLSVLAKFLLAEADDAQGKVEDARRLYGELIVQAPTFNGALLREGQLLMKMGKAEGADELLLKLLFADPDDSEARQALFKLGY